MQTKASNYSCVAAELDSIKANKTSYSIRVFLNSTGNTLGKKKQTSDTYFKKLPVTLRIGTLFTLICLKILWCFFNMSKS